MAPWLQCLVYASDRNQISSLYISTPSPAGDATGDADGDVNASVSYVSHIGLQTATQLTRTRKGVQATLNFSLLTLQ